MTPAAREHRLLELRAEAVTRMLQALDQLCDEFPDESFATIVLALALVERSGRHNKRNTSQLLRAAREMVTEALKRVGPDATVFELIVEAHL
jgi:hypothetical protein